MQTKFKFFLSVAVFSILTATVLCQDLQAGDSWDKERETAKNSVSIEKLEREISFLTDSICQGRASGTSGSMEAAMWIRRQFKGAGLVKMTDSWTQGFSIRHDIKGRNVIGMLPGAKSIPYDRYIIVGAHYDHLGFLDGKFYPGADSNASGVVAMTNLAEMFGKMRKMGKIFRCNIIFVAFDAKEYDLRGSQALWDMIEYERLVNPLTGKTITKDKVDLMVNIDQIGSSLAPVNKGRPDYMIMLGTSSLPKAKRNLLESCNRDESIEMDISLDYYGSTNFTNIFYKLSDQKVFAENGIPAVMFTSGITMNTNKTRDTAASLDMKILQKRIFLIFHWIDKML